MHPTDLRAWWSHRQGLDGSLRGASPAAVLEHAGWSRSVGGVSPYLTLYARAGVRRAEADAAAATQAIHELPSARGCTYLLPAADYAVGLTVGRSAGMAETKAALRLGVTEAELDALGEAVLAALEDGATLTPDQLRAAVGPAARSLGEEGKKKGITTTLPVALGRLQVAARIRRLPIDGRLDQQRYAYAIWRPSPLDRCALTEAQAYTELARRFFRQVGPATLAELQGYMGLSAKGTREACAPLGLVPVLGDRLLLPNDVDSFRGFEAPSKPQYALVGSLDSIVAARRDLMSLLDEADRGHPALGGAALVTLGALGDLPSHAILDRGRLIGLWEYDPAAGAIAWTTFQPADDALRAEIARTEAFVREELGDARTFSLDSPKSRAARIAALRAS